VLGLIGRWLRWLRMSRSNDRATLSGGGPGRNRGDAPIEVPESRFRTALAAIAALPDVRSVASCCATLRAQLRRKPAAPGRSIVRLP